MNKISLIENKIIMEGNSTVVYRKGDMVLHAQETNDDVIITREERKKGNTLFLRISVKNSGKTPLYIESISPLVIDKLSMPAATTDWHVFLDGRHKNDLPAVCCLGVEDEAMVDATGGLTEGGEYVIPRKLNGDLSLKSDRMLQIHTEEATVTFSFRSAQNCFFRMELNISADKSFSGLGLFCDWKAVLPPDETAYSEWLAIDTEPDPLRAIDSFAKTYKKNKKKKAPIVYSTWYYYGMDITPQTIRANIEEIRKQNLPFDVFQLDDGWEASYGNWEPNLKFPNGMEEIAAWIQKAGMKAGIWTCPFTIHQNAPIIKEHPEWILKQKNGEYCYFKVNDRICKVLDVTHPGVVQYLENLYRVLTNWGFTYHKLDFTRCAILYEDADFYDAEKPPIRAYCEAMRAIRRGMGDDSFLLICGGLYDPLVDIADGQRTGSDVLSMWKREGRLCLPFTVKQNTLRYYMNEWWHNDSDSLMVRRNDKMCSENMLALGTLSDVEAQTFTANQYCGGGLVGMTECLPEIDKDRLSLLQHITPIVETEIHPLSLYGSRFVSDIVVHIKEKGYNTVVHINWSDESQPFSLCLSSRIAPKDSEYVVAEFFSGKVFETVHQNETVSFESVPPHGVAIVKIAEKKLPMIVGSNAHFSMGGEVTEILENQDGTIDVKTICPTGFEAKYMVLTKKGILYFNKKK